MYKAVASRVISRILLPCHHHVSLLARVISKRREVKSVCVCVFLVNEKNVGV